MITAWSIFAVGCRVGRAGEADLRAVPTGRRVEDYVHGLPGRVRAQERWTVVEHAVAVCPDGMQRLLGNAGWDIDGAR